MESEYPNEKEEKIPIGKLEELEQLLCTKEMAQFFGLSIEKIRVFLKSMDFSKGGFSPMFLSPGFGDNETFNPRTRTSFIANDLSTIFHEAKHGLHFLVCVEVFRDSELYKEAFSLFCDNVLGDEEFIIEINKKGTKLQKEFIQQAINLKNKNQILLKDIYNLSVILGVITYQHAYFVDSGMCEAVASYGDFGQTWIVGFINRIMASLIPHEKFALKGYGNKDYQNMFKGADLLKKAFLVKKSKYNRENFFNQ